MSLETRYRELLRLDTKVADGDGSLLVGAATPNDYLEKIFQIPFWLKPMDSKACENMVGGLLKLSVVQDTSPTIAATVSAASAEGNGTVRGAEPQPSAQPESGPAEHSAGSSGSPAPQPPGLPTPPIGEKPRTPKETPPVLDLTITREELDYMRRLSGVLGRSPRALKRFVNVYRLIKAGLNEHELRVFTRERLPIADYQAVLFLLAVDTAAPLVAKAFFATIDEMVDARATANDALGVRSLVNRLEKDETLKKVPDWQRLRSWLTTQRDVVSRDADLSLLRSWTSRVGRYSFEVGR